MEKHFITALLVLMLLAPQTGLEAKSRHHGVKERDHDAEERDHEDKKRYHKSKRRHHSRHRGSSKFHRFARATKAEMALLKQSIAEINAKMGALEPQSQLSADLAAQLDALQLAIYDNSSDIFSILGDITTILEDIKGVSENGIQLDELKLTVADLSLELAALTLTVGALDLRISTLEQSSPPSVSEHVFLGDFTQGVPSIVDTQQLAWNQFVGNITGKFTSIEIRNSLGGSALCSNPLVSTDIANALKSFVTGSAVEEFNCGVNQEWSVGDCGSSGVALHAGPTTACSACEDGATVRPLIGNQNWGGIGTTCNAPTQTLEVILTR